MLDVEQRLYDLFTHDGMAERVTIWHPGRGQLDRVDIQLMADEMDAVHGQGQTISEAVEDLKANQRALDRRAQAG